ncbi:MAG TPA: SMP-30/gluconolactonase/LRE family protein [Solirubrobacteraceae bacterium]
MSSAVRRFAACQSLCIALTWCSVSASQASVLPDGSSSNPIAAALVVPDVQLLDEGQQLGTVEEALRDSPEAVAARSASRTRFERLGLQQAAEAAKAAFPELMSEPAGGPPRLPGGQKIIDFKAANIAQVALGAHDVGLIESSAPMARRTAGGSWQPIALNLRATGNAFTASDPLVNVRLPTRLSEGARIADVSLTPVTKAGVPLAGSDGQSNGATVFFSNTGQDSDTILKPSPRGLAVNTLVRSIASPERFYFRIGLPAGAHLVKGAQGTGGARVVKEGSTIGIIPAPEAMDAAGTAVPVSMGVSTDTLVVSVNHRSGSYRYPIVVDPEYVALTEGLVAGNWHFYQAGGYSTEVARSLVMTHTGSFGTGDYGFWKMQTQGYTKIYAVSGGIGLNPRYTHGFGESFIYSYMSAWLELAGPKERHQLDVGNPPNPPLESATLCANTGCSAEGVEANNSAGFELTTVEPGSATFGGSIEPTVYIAQENSKSSQAHSNTNYPEIETVSEGKPVKYVNALYRDSVWFGPHSGAVEIYSSDGGLGVSEMAIELNQGRGWETESTQLFGRTEYLKTPSCIGVQCDESQTRVFTYEELRGNTADRLPEGEYELRSVAHSAMPGSGSSEHELGEDHGVKVDATPPHGIKTTGLTSVEKKTEREGKVEEHAVFQLGETEAHVKVEATDGEGTTPSSGIRSLALGVNGKEIGTAGGSCTRGPCTATHEFAINGAELGVGNYTLTVVATDNAGNVATSSYKLAVYHASPVAMGPGSVNPESGDFALESTDVNLSGGLGPLTISRHYDSRNLTEGGPGPLGPQWEIGLGSLAELEVLPDGSVMVIGPEGLTHFATKEGGGFEAPEGDTNLTLEYEPKKPAYLVGDPTQGTTTEFTLPKGAPNWLPTVSEGPVATDKTTDEYRTVEVPGATTIVQPTLELAPHPTATCGHEQLEKLEIVAKGCRALKFVYDEKETTAKGEAKTEWGEYKNRLKEVIAIAYSPATKAMTKTAVAAYEYDAKGRLRAEWDPQISPALRTTYGYDSEGHVTALTPPGQQSWMFTYGRTAEDPSAGRLLKVYRTPASTPLWKGEPPKPGTEAPKVTGSPMMVGVTLATSHGTWTGEPQTYAFQWEDCNTEGKECTPIVGAVNANYKLTQSDVGHTLVARVTAINGGGAVSNVSVATGPTVAVEVAEFPVAAGTDPYGITSGPDGNIWYADVYARKVGKVTPSGTNTEYTLPETGSIGGFGIAAGSDGNLWFSDLGAQKIAKITTSGTTTEYTLPTKEVDGPYGITHGPDGNVWFTEVATSKIGKITPSGTITEYALPAGSQPEAITTGPDGNLWYVTVGTSKIGKITPSGVITEYALPAKSDPSGITTGPDGNVWYTEANTSKIGKITPSGTITEYPVPGAVPGDITPGPEGNLWYTNGDFSRIGLITTSGTVSEYQLPAEGRPNAITKGPEGNMWYTDEGSNKIGRITTKPTIKEGEALASQPGATIEYGVPLEGTEAPDQLGTSKETGKPEPERWAQTDDPVYGTAILPPSEPMGWPASSYKGATVSYMDGEARTVNVANAAGGIATTEYDEDNEVTRTLSPQDRATALKESNPAAAAELLDTKSAYNSEGLLTDTWGPQHPVRLAAGEKGPNEEALARDHVAYFYNEGAEPVEAAKEESYELVTKTTDAAETANKNQYDKRTTLTSYNGQHDLGWTLRKPTSTTSNPEGLALTQTTEYNEAGNVTETKAPEGTAEVVYPPVYQTAFGSSGSGSGQFNHPEGVATDASGNVWVADQSNNRIEKFSATGTYLAAYGTKGTGADQFSTPWGVAVNQSTGNVYVTDAGNSRVEELNSSGAFVEVIGWGVSDGKAELEVCKASCKAAIAGAGNGQLEEPVGLTLDSTGNIWIADSGNNRIQELSAAGTYLTQFASKGSGNGQLTEPTDVAIDEGEFYVVDYGNDRVEEFSPSGGYLAQFGSKGSGEGQFNYPVGVAVNATSGDLYVSDAGDSRIEQFTPAGKSLTEFGTYGTGNGQLDAPTGLAVSSTGTLYIADQYNERISDWLPPGAGGARMLYQAQFGSAGSGNGQFAYPFSDAIDGHGNVWVTDLVNNRIEELSSAGKFVAAYGTHGSGHGQFSEPTGIAVNQSTGNVYVGDCGNDRVQELTSTGEYVTAFGGAGSEPGEMGCPDGVKIDASGNVWVVDIEHDRIEEYSSAGKFIAAYGKAGSGEVQFSSPTDLAFSGGNVYVVDAGNHRVEELSAAGKYLGQFGSTGGGDGQFYEPAGIAADPAGNLYVVDSSNGRVQEFSAAGTFLARFGSIGSGEGQLAEPIGLAINAAGSAYVVDSTDNRVEQWIPVEEAVHDSKTTYYTAKGEAEVAACREHPEWVGLPCQTAPVAQPSATEPPNLPVVTITYNLWDQPETVEEAFGSTIRTKKTTFEPSGRPEATETKSSIDTALPKITDKYNTLTGVTETQSTTTGETTKTLTSKYNTLGQLTSYTDAEGNTATYEYEPEKDGRLTKVSDPKGNQTYAYDPTTGGLKELHDSAAGTFTATRNVEGAITSETYPDGLTVSYTENSVGAATAIEYKKTTHCGTSCTWFADADVPSIHGETLKQTSTLSEEPTYTYDAAGRLLQTQEIPAGEGCKTRLYNYDEENNRTSETTREPGTEGKCATEGGTTERHTYDNANRLTDVGVVYDAFGNTTTLPAADAGGSPIESSYYVDNQVFKQTQSEETTEYKLDPEGRPRETASSGKTSAKVVSHYDGPGNALAWTSESTEKWSRNIPGIGGELQAVQTSAGHTVLELHDLQGNIVATAGLSETETALLSKYNSSEFGVPTSKEKPPTYAWLGAEGVSSESAAGTITQDGVTYVPQTGRALQTQAVEIPSPANAATPFVSIQSQWVIQSGIEASARQVALAEEARRAAAGGEPSHRASWEGSGPLIGGCTGTHACAASNIHCGLKSLFGEPEGGVLWLAGVIKCNQTVRGIQVELCMSAWSPSEHVYKQFVCNGPKQKGETYYDTNKGGEILEEDCAEGLNYKAWAWGDAWGSGYWFVATGQVSEPWKCEGNYAEGATEFSEFLFGH